MNIIIYLNNKEVIIDRGANLNDILLCHNIGTHSLAAVVNHRIIPRSDWHLITAQEGDRITLIPPTV